MKGICMFILAAIILFPHTAPYGASPDRIESEALQESSDRLSISIQDADIRSVLKALSVKKKLNIVTAQDVTGKVSINLYNIPLKDALDAIITLNGYSYVQRDNIIFVTRDDDSSEGTSEGEEVRTFKLKYADIEAVEKAISKFLSSSARVTIYKPEKTLIVEDVPENLDRIRQLLDSLDIPPKQVLIETRIMAVRLNDDTSLGIDWNSTFKGFINSSGEIFTQGFTGNSQGFFFNLVNGDFELFLDALQSRSEVNSLASPKLLALDNKKAKIIIGDKLGYNVTTAVDSTVLQSVEFLETGTQLVLTPHIIDDGMVIMDIHPEVSDGIIVEGLPTKTTTEVTTSLMAPDGGTIFIGGLIRDRKEDIVNRVPGLGEIPVLGALFSSTVNTTVRTEIIVLITPHIITAGNTGLLEQDTDRVEKTAEELEKKRSLRELLPGTSALN